MNALVSAVKGMAATLNRVAGIRGHYSRRGEGNEFINAVLTEREYQVVDDQGIVTVVKSHDWLFQACDLGKLMPPELGDCWKVRSDYGLDSAQREDFNLPYEAMEIGNRPCFETHDAQGVMVVVHMKRVPDG